MSTRYVVAVDPGTGVKSPAGLAIFDPITLDISAAEALWCPNDKDPDKRIRFIVAAFSSALKFYKNEELALFCIEDFVMRGKGGVTLQKMIGAVVSRVPDEIPVIHVQNTRVKSLVAGNGAADKLEVGLGVLKYFSKNERSAAQISLLIEDEEWDILDAFAIGIAGLKDWGKKSGKV